MDKIFKLYRISALTLVFLFSAILPRWNGLSALWNNKLYNNGGDYWRCRYVVTITNSSNTPIEGTPVEIVVSNRGLNIVGESAGTIRVCDERGVELLFGILDATDQWISRDKIQLNSKLIIPVSVYGKSQTNIYIYFQNPSAWNVPDFWQVKASILNGSVESGEGDTPFHWVHDKPDATHRTFWVEENPHSGKKCLKTMVDVAAEPTWISTRQTGIRVFPNTKYRFRGYVRAQNVKGSVGWYVHAGNAEQPLIISPMATVDGGDFDWREVSVEFTTPTNADRISVGTVLYGTGTAWFDDARIEQVNNSVPLKIVNIQRETLPEIREFGRVESAINLKSDDWLFCLPIRIDNIDKNPTDETLVFIDLLPVLTRYGKFIDREKIEVLDSEKRKYETFLFGKRLFIKANVGEMSRKYFYAYFYKRSDLRKPAELTRPGSVNVVNPALPGSEIASLDSNISKQQYLKLLTNEVNLLRNPNFEVGDKLPTDWTGAIQNDKKVIMELSSPGLLGNKAVHMNVDSTAPKAWRGWRQTVKIKPGGSYFYAGWVKCSNIVSGSVALHGHAKTSNGNICSSGGYHSVGPSVQGNKDWTLLEGICVVPQDAALFEIHLTAEQQGEIWHDGIVFAPIKEAYNLPIQWNESKLGDEIVVWQIPAIAKVFKDDFVINKGGSFYISSAKNEREPLQFAVRSRRDFDRVEIEVTAPVNKEWFKINPPEIGVVGFVPIDHVSGYYQSLAPEWHRKIPNYRSNSDGWVGFWADPIFPTNSFPLIKNETQPVWLTFKAPSNVPAGTYTGKIVVKSGGKVLKQVAYEWRIRDFALSDKPSVKAIYDVRSAVSRWAPAGSDNEKLRMEVWKFMAERRLCPDTIKPEPVIEYKNGRVEARFDEFDRMAKFYLDELNFPHFYTPWQFYCFGWGLPPGRKFGEAPYPGNPPYQGVDREVLREEFKNAYKTCLKAFWEHIRTNGWAEKCILYISDEPFDNQPEIIKQMKALCRMIHEVDPTIPIYSSTWHHQPQWDGFITVWGLGNHGAVPVERLEQIKKSGARILWTTDGYMCIDTPNCAVERLLPHFAFHYGAEGYEFWGIDWLTYNPYEFGWHSFIRQTDQPGRTYWVRYPNGDGYLMYPGREFNRLKPVPSIRVEQAAEGCEDFEYLKILSERLNRSGFPANKVEEGRRLLAAAKRFTPIPHSGIRYSSNLLPDPDELYELREQIGKLIEELK